jgi:hypothetical protein
VAHSPTNAKPSRCRLTTTTRRRPAIARWSRCSPDGQAHTECFQRVADDPNLVPEAALDTIMEFLRRDARLLSHVNADDDLAAAIVALNFARDTSWPDQDWTTEWSR